MIVLDLSCENDHAFEGWFASASAFESQLERRLVECPICASTKIVRKLSAPYVNTRSSAAHLPSQRPPGEPVKTASPPVSVPAPAPTPEAVAAVMKALRQMASSSEDVGKRFPEEARRIHYGEAAARSIKGQASADDVGELIEEGIMVVPLPPDDSDLH